MFSFLVETMETAVRSWHETSKVDARVFFLLDKEKTETDKYAPIVNIDKVGTFCQKRFLKHHSASLFENFNFEVIGAMSAIFAVKDKKSVSY